MNYDLLAQVSLLAACAGVATYAWRMTTATNLTKSHKYETLALCEREGRLLQFVDDVSISFIDHHREIMWFRNPWRLYSVRFLDFLYNHEYISLKDWTDARAHAYVREKMALNIAQLAINDAEQRAGRRSDTHAEFPRNG